MRTSVLLAVLAIAVGTSRTTAASKIPVSKYSPETNGLLSGISIGDLPQISHLPVALFQETNTTFDAKIYESVRTATTPPIVVSFLLVTFIFSSPNTNTSVYSFSEMGQPDELFCTGTNICRRPGSINEIPLIRVSTVDRNKKDLTADIDLLIGVAPAADPEDIRYLRRSFRFVYRDGWKED